MTIVSELTRAIVVLAVLVVVGFLIFKTQSLWQKVLNNMITKAEKKVDVDIEASDTGGEDVIDRHIKSSPACIAGETKQCIIEAMVHPIHFTMDRSDLQGIPTHIAFKEDSKIDLGISDDDFWTTKGNNIGSAVDKGAAETAKKGQALANRRRTLAYLEEKFGSSDTPQSEKDQLAARIVRIKYEIEQMQK